MAAPENRLVIGLDYGTTFTGVAYQDVSVNSGEIDVDKILLVDLWPPRKTSAKVPSEISYSAAPGRERQWGYDISSKAVKMVWTKLELDRQEKFDELRMIVNALNGMKNLKLEEIARSGGIPEYPAMDPEDLVADYLTKVREHVFQALVQRYSAEYLAVVPIDLVITVPAVWSDEAKNKTFRAVSRAKFDNTYFKKLRHVIMVPEPEAAALYTLKSLQLHNDEDEPIQPGDCFVLCDAGGGTVDLISYRIKQVNPTLQVEEVALGTGAKYGASLIDRNFRRWLEARLGAEDFRKLSGSPEDNIGSHNVVEAKMQRIMTEFEVIKKSFKGLGDPEDGIIPLPAPLNDINDAQRGIEDGEIRITDKDLREMFRQSVDKTIELITGQLNSVRFAGHSVRYVFLSGGFGESEYLFNKVKAFLRMRNIALRRPKNPWSAVVRGAVTKGLDAVTGNMVYMQKCRRSYGIRVSESFSEFKHDRDDAQLDGFDGDKKARSQMIWLIKKGDAIISNETKHASIETCQSFGVKDPRVFRVSLVACDIDKPPQRFEDIPAASRSISHLTYDLTDIAENKFQACRAGSNGKPYLKAYFRLELDLKNTIKFSMVFDGQELASVPVA